MGNGGSRASNSLSNDNDNNNIDHPGDGFCGQGQEAGEGQVCSGRREGEGRGW